MIFRIKNSHNQRKLSQVFHNTPRGISFFSSSLLLNFNMIFITRKKKREEWQWELFLTFRVEQPRYQKLFVSHIKCVVKVGSVIVLQEAFKFK